MIPAVSNAPTVSSSAASGTTIQRAANVAEQAATTQHRSNSSPARPPEPPRVRKTERVVDTRDSVDLTQATFAAQIIVAIRTKFNESQRLVDITA